MTIYISEWNITLQFQSLGLDLKDRPGKSRLSNQVRQAMTSPAVRSQVATPTNLQYYIDLYGEQVTTDAVADLRQYFQQMQARGFTTVGGLTTQLTPLWIGSADIRPSNTAISVVGEGLSGWHLEQRGWVPLARPIGESVDLIFEQAIARPRTYALIQAKAITDLGIIGQMRRAVPDLLQYAYNVAATTPPKTYSCFMLGIFIRRTGDLELSSLKIDFV